MFRYSEQTPCFLVARANTVPISFHVQAYHDVFLCPEIQHAPASFLGELFRVSADPSIISFAGGLPSSALIDAEGLSDAARDVFATDPRTALQVPRRPTVTCRCGNTSRHGTARRLGVPATAGEIQITNGSQQCLDLFAKIFLNAGDRVGMERPGTSGRSRPSRSTSRSLRPCGSTAKGRIPVRLKKCSWRDR